jgi:3-hydroxyacyl-CoA dehydrogenase
MARKKRVNVVIVGENPIVEELCRICAESGHHVDVYITEDFLAEAKNKLVLEELAEKTDISIEAHDESAETKCGLLRAIDASLPSAAVLFTSALVASATQAAAWTQNPGRVVGYGLLSPID